MNETNQRFEAIIVLELQAKTIFSTRRKLKQLLIYSKFSSWYFYISFYFTAQLLHIYEINCVFNFVSRCVWVCLSMCVFHSINLSKTISYRKKIYVILSQWINFRKFSMLEISASTGIWTHDLLHAGQVFLLISLIIFVV